MGRKVYKDMIARNSGGWFHAGSAEWGMKGQRCLIGGKVWLCNGYIMSMIIGEECG